ncbi:MAG: hypothetical protein RI885_82 [Actinomycetota bacterium]|jgi:AcrR family transcriptional regulator
MRPRGLCEGSEEVESNTVRTEQAQATRDRIVDAASDLLSSGGRDAVSTRAISAAARVQAPTIYRLFGDKQGLLDAVAIHGYLAYLDDHANRAGDDDPVEALRRGWDLHVEFGLANPYIYSLIYGQPSPGRPSGAMLAAAEVVRGLVRPIAASGRLGVGVDLAVSMITSAGSGAVLTLIGQPEDQRDPRMSQLARENMLRSITTDDDTAGHPVASVPSHGGPVAAAVALLELLPHTAALTAAEQVLLGEWLERIIDHGR